jgi:hypothetical protein
MPISSLLARIAVGCRGWFRAGLFVTAACLAACGTGTTPEQQVRAVIAQGERAAEARDVSGMMALVSSRYQDDDNGNAVELSHLLRGYFIANQSVHLATRVDSIEFPYQDMARVQVTVGMLGREAAPGAGLDLAADLHEVRLELQLERGDWRVTRAEWHSLVRD